MMHRDTHVEQRGLTDGKENALVQWITHMCLSGQTPTPQTVCEVDFAIQANCILATPPTIPHTIPHIGRNYIFKLSNLLTVMTMRPQILSTWTRQDQLLAKHNPQGSSASYTQRLSRQNRQRASGSHQSGASAPQGDCFLPSSYPRGPPPSMQLG